MEYRLTKLCVFRDSIFLSSWSKINFFICMLFVVLIPACDSAVRCDRDPYHAKCQDENAWRLDYDLFTRRNYNPLIRPVVDSRSSLNINFSLALSCVINLDSKNQVMVVNVWLQMFWHDYQMAWNPADYGYINETRSNVERIWVPDIVLFNNADGNYEPSYVPNVLVYANGDIKFIPPSIYTSSCSIDVEYFPFDQQVCQLKFGSWTFSGRTLKYSFYLGQHWIDMIDYMRNGAWDIISCDGHIDTINDTVTGEPKQIIVYDMVMRRKTLFYTVNLIIPTFLHAFVCLCVFVLPADGCEKMTLVISTLVSLVVFLVMVQRILPPSIKIPLIAKYLLFTFLMNVFEILVTVIIIFANHKNPRTDSMPRWVCWLFLYKLPKYLFMERPDHNERWEPKSCDEPPSYPSTPQIPRAMIRTIPPDLRQRLTRVCPSASQIDLPSREKDRVNSLRKDFKMQHRGGSSARSSMGSGSQMSGEDSSAGAEVAESLGMESHHNYPLPPFNGHRCVLRESAMSRSRDTLDDEVRPLSPQTVSASPQTGPIPPRAQWDEREDGGRPLWTRKQIRSAMNAIKYIWRQMKNKDEYETVKDDWKFVAAVLDRLLMIIFILVTVCGTLGVLVNAPYILETVDEEQIIKDMINRAA